MRRVEGFFFKNGRYFYDGNDLYEEKLMFERGGIILEEKLLGRWEWIGFSVFVEGMVFGIKVFYLWD